MAEKLERQKWELELIQRQFDAVVQKNPDVRTSVRAEDCLGTCDDTCDCDLEVLPEPVPDNPALRGYGAMFALGMANFS